LRVLKLPANRLHGGVPAALARLPMLEELWLSGNDLRGPLPSAEALAPLRKLRVLDLRDNEVHF
jgi:hypothetical protein